MGTAWKSILLAYLVVLACILVFRIYIGSDMPLLALVDAAYDDRYFVQQARYLYTGEWLGPYRDLTLIKGIFYSLWIAIVDATGLELLFAQQLLYMFSCALIVQAAKPLVPNQWIRLILFLVLIFNPISYADAVSTRAIRSGIYPSLTLLVFAGLIRLVASTDSTVSGSKRWALLAALSLAAFWLTREEGIWLLPSISLLLGYSVLKRHRSGLLSVSCTKTHLLVIWIPLVAVGFVSAINWYNYGVFRTNDILSTPFKKAYGAMTRVTPTTWYPRVPLTQETRERIYQESPLFEKLREELESTSLSWARSEKAQDGYADYGGGHLMWAIRRASQKAGLMSSAVDADTYFEKLANEINTACAEGRLACGPPRTGMMPPLRREYLVGMPRKLEEAFSFLINFSGKLSHVPLSIGSIPNFRLFRKMIDGEFSPALWSVDTESIRFRLKAFSVHGPVSVRVVDREQALLAGPFVQTPDIKNGNTRIWGLSKKRWLDIQAPCPNGCHLEFYVGSDRIKSVAVNGADRLHRTRALSYQIVVPIPSSVRASKVRRDRGADAYGAIAPGFIVIGLLFFVVIIARNIRRKRLGAEVVVILALYGAVLTRLGIVTLVDLTSFDAINRTYLSPAYPLILAATVLSIALPLSWIRGINQKTAGKPLNIG